ncbi:MULTISPECIES: DUF86 domain-containing protein [unclassified Roseofilum]|uniref:HepT-like ribonuclease domain-containing protein n=1 Tax=unclassified Roseofilum TaxID=2620099 RepID=UPI000E989BFC|nr:MULTISPECIES: DUF86 domain-containing protein [unclassified Roseofilum]HBQ99468.1 hypothetical protein [Cyanobacteria bacterium UBA11691]MBP0009793.1 DUF86 domain-containing protein [Roseofilum sp. Belize Diploria]MBP0012244.1 DUF86 domain-containing protein [Roseofilum sp. SID3]MBP0025038.1 DUF86 domain-containing protein [Roseofilum sp. SID2]MBP0034243.1 DUF86 domain-containing protein [Roseofilum sp. Belize BBD 4]
MNRDPFYLLDIAQNAQDIINFVQDMDEATFLTDLKSQKAILYSITIIGEATKKLSTQLRQQNPHIPWRQIAGMRDKCVHDYRQIDLSQVWEITQTSIPELLENIKLLLPVQEEQQE